MIDLAEVIDHVQNHAEGCSICRDAAQALRLLVAEVQTRRAHAADARRAYHPYNDKRVHDASAATDAALDLSEVKRD